jgi:hypothetical protein
MNINLGPDCYLAGILKDYNILSDRSPFDSVITNHKSLCDCLNDNFEKFYDIKYFKLYFDKQSPVNYYGIVIAHNFKLQNFECENYNKESFIKKCKIITNFDFENEIDAFNYYQINITNIINNKLCGGIIDFNNKSIEEFIIKYKRRIGYFLNKVHGNKQIYFYRMINNINESYEIKNILENKFSNKNYKLICIIRNSELTNFKIQTSDDKIIIYNNKYYNPLQEKIFYEKVFFDVKNMNNNFFNNIINKLNTNYLNNIQLLINPMSMYFISDYYYGTELEINIECIKREIGIEECNHNFISNYMKSKNIYKNNNIIEKILDYNIIAIQGGPEYSSNWEFNFYTEFCTKIMPKINKKIILIIGHYSLSHFINYDENIKNIIKNEKVILCFLQNYGMIKDLLKIDKIKCFPFGFQASKESLENYIKVLKLYHLKKKILKKNNIEHLYIGPSWIGREIFPKKKKLAQVDYYKKIAESNFLLSPCGDRWDTFRNYECIGLETIPISHKGALELIFNNNMLYISCDDNKNIQHTPYINFLDNDNDEKKIKYMLDLLDNNKLKNNYITKPNCDLITTEYWKFFVNTMINFYKNN